MEQLAKHHDKKNFDCGNDEINRYLQTMASQHAKKGISQTHVLANDDTIRGFYTLSVINLDNQQGMIKGYPLFIPAVLIGRVGVALNEQGQGLANQLISHAMNQIKAISHIVGVAFVVIDAKTDKLADYYERLGFIRLLDLRLVYPVGQI